MQKSIALLLICSPLAFAANIYSTPSEKANVISAVDASHEYDIKPQDWVEITDHTTNSTGWAKLSELKQDLSQNSQWSYQWESTASGSQQSMHYKPYSSEDMNKHIQKIHLQHKKIMSSFDAFWQDLDDVQSDQA